MKSASSNRLSNKSGRGSIHEGLLFSPLTEALLNTSHYNDNEKNVTGVVRLSLFKGHCTVNGRKSPKSLYNEKLATYTVEDTFDHDAAVGFIHLWGLPTKVYAQVNREADSG